MKTITLTLCLFLLAVAGYARQSADFQFCLQDNADPTTYVLLNGNTGDFAYYCAGAINASGRGTVTHKGGAGIIQQVKGARIVRIEWNANTGSAYVSHSGVPSCQITDSNIADNSCNP